MEQRIAIYGAGGFGREVLQVLRDINAVAPTWACAGFLVDPGFDSPAQVAGLPVLGGVDWLAANPDVWVVVAIGSSAARRQVVERIRQQCPNRFATLVHPRAWMGEGVHLGEGTIFCAGALATTDIRIGAHVQVHVGCTIGHDADLRDFVTLTPRGCVSGNVSIHEGTDVGAGAVILPKCVIGHWSVVGAGTVVTRSLPDNVVAVGVPARVAKERQPGWHLQG